MNVSMANFACLFEILWLFHSNEIGEAKKTKNHSKFYITQHKRVWHCLWFSTVQFINSQNIVHPHVHWYSLQTWYTTQYTQSCIINTKQNGYHEYLHASIQSYGTKLSTDCTYTTLKRYFSRLLAFVPTPQTHRYICT